mmetsp:Transcript_33786/g.41779  ORF Transcript_33786/g.41779 Transcript_33786/m.41779 type:complete len:179 (-) Transcript_33786:3673-4209(-)
MATNNRVEGSDVAMSESAASQAASDITMPSSTTASTAADSMRAAPAGGDSAAAKESVAPRKRSQIKNPDEQNVCISGQAQKSGESEEEPEPQKALKGLQNQGATCYMNSLLQALYMTPDFRQMIYKFNYDPNINSEKKDCILYQLQKLFATLQIGKLPYASTTDLTNSFGWDTSQSFE